MTDNFTVEKRLESTSIGAKLFLARIRRPGIGVEYTHITPDGERVSKFYRSKRNARAELEESSRAIETGQQSEYRDNRGREGAEPLVDFGFGSDSSDDSFEPLISDPLAEDEDRDEDGGLFGGFF